jgi:hypothetical protein
LQPIRYDPLSGDALVDVETAEKIDTTQTNGKTSTKPYDLRLFRNGQLVGQWPEPGEGNDGPPTTVAWRMASPVPMAQGKTTTLHTFRVALPSQERGKPVMFTAYAFNEDRVKSETARNNDGFKVPDTMPLRRRRAYVITIGVNAYDREDLALSFAAKDARDLRAALAHIKGYEVVSLSLVSEQAHKGAEALQHATKRNIRTALQLLAGRSEADRGRLRNEPGIDNRAVDQLRKATPDDLVIIAFSGHGYTAPHSGQFYLLPSDSGKGPGFGPDVLTRLISSQELSDWLRDVDAGQMAMIIDACHSAASVDSPGFKPGPMGDRGLGQLAYDKGMMILAAAQASDVALEINKIQQGLLTYALVVDGLSKARAAGRLRDADLDRNGTLTLKEWLQYGAQRVPDLYHDILSGKIKAVRRDPRPADANWRDITMRRAQTPSLFDFRRNNESAELP